MVSGSGRGAAATEAGGGGSGSVLASSSCWRSAAGWSGGGGGEGGQLRPRPAPPTSGEHGGVGSFGFRGFLAAARRGSVVRSGAAAWKQGNLLVVDKIFYI